MTLQMDDEKKHTSALEVDCHSSNSSDLSNHKSIVPLVKGADTLLEKRLVRKLDFT
jgi:hypothetical protein